jgi:hypothetical protein
VHNLGCYILRGKYFKLNISAGIFEVRRCYVKYAKYVGRGIPRHAVNNDTCCKPTTFDFRLPSVRPGNISPFPVGAKIFSFSTD